MSTQTVQKPCRHDRLNLGWDTTTKPNNTPPKGGVFMRKRPQREGLLQKSFLCESTSRVSNDAVRSVVARQDTHRRERAGVYGM